jgi:hypothetical protein
MMAIANGFLTRTSCLVAFGTLAWVPVLSEGLPGTGHLSLNSGRFIVDYDEQKWRLKDHEDAWHYTLRHRSGRGMVMVFAEVEGAPFREDSIPYAALAETRSEDPNAKIVLQEKRLVHGVQMWCIKIESNVKDVPVVYYGYYYAGKAGDVRVITFVQKEYLKSLERDFTKFLNGLRIEE